MWNSNEPCGCRNFDDVESGGLLPEQLLRTGDVVVDTWLRLVAILERRIGDGADTAEYEGGLGVARTYRIA